MILILTYWNSLRYCFDHIMILSDYKSFLTQRRKVAKSCYYLLCVLAPLRPCVDNILCRPIKNRFIEIPSAILLYQQTTVS